MSESATTVVYLPKTKTILRTAKKAAVATSLVVTGAVVVYVGAKLVAPKVADAIEDNA